MPELGASDIAHAHAALKSGRPTIGKDFRGGSFLIGLLKDSFRQNQFANLPWQTSRIACALKKELAIACTGDEAEVFELENRADCNTRQDLINFTKRSASESWAYLLHTTTGRICDIETGHVLVSRFGESRTKRGPPTTVVAA